MDIGRNIHDLLLSNIEPIALLGIAMLGLWFLVKRELTKFIGVVIIGILAIGFIFNPLGVKDIMLFIFNKIIGK